MKCLRYGFAGALIALPVDLFEVYTNWASVHGDGRLALWSWFLVPGAAVFPQVRAGPYQLAVSLVLGFGFGITVEHFLLCNVLEQLMIQGLVPWGNVGPTDWRYYLSLENVGFSLLYCGFLVALAALERAVVVMVGMVGRREALQWRSWWPAFRDW